MSDSKKIRILAVDDDPLNLEIIEHSLAQKGYDIVSVPDGSKALALLNSSPEDFDIILLDRMMPGMDGMEVLKKMKENPKLKDIHVIMQTASSQKSQIEEGMKAGAYYYLTKPYNKKALGKIVEAAANNVRKLHRKDIKPNFVQGVDECYFEIQTLEEAELTTLYLANLFPYPDEMLFGIKELLINAIEHGNLDIDYDLKSELNSRGVWREEVEKRLALPEYAARKVRIYFYQRADHIELIVKDEGKGFDWQKYTQIDPSRTVDTQGRGISIASLKCFDELNYIGSGNEVHVKVYLKNERDKKIDITSNPMHNIEATSDNNKPQENW